jgi:ParB family chromosome partitioning protein
MDPERETVTGVNGDDTALVRLFLRLLDLPDAAINDVIVIVIAMSETLAAAARRSRRSGNRMRLASEASLYRAPSGSNP